VSPASFSATGRACRTGQYCSIVKFVFRPCGDRVRSRPKKILSFQRIYLELDSQDGVLESVVALLGDVGDRSHGLGREHDLSLP
jgi:hypothetical protein